MHLIALQDMPAQPWRNGGGQTRELLAWPPAAPWQWRISVATIDRSGPFSAFPGVERWLAVLRGEGLVLRFAQRRAMLTVDSEPLRFEGSAQPGCELLDGSTEDLNMMVQSEHGSAAMFRVKHTGTGIGTAPAGGSSVWQSRAPLRAVFTSAACRLRRAGAADLTLAADTLAWTDNAADIDWSLHPALNATTPLGAAWWLQFKPRSS